MQKYYSSLESIDDLELTVWDRPKAIELAAHPNVLMRLVVARNVDAPELYPKLFLNDRNGKWSGFLVDDWFVLRKAARQNPGVPQAMLEKVAGLNAKEEMHDPNDGLVQTALDAYNEQEIRELAKHPNGYVVEGIAKNIAAAQDCPDLFLK